MRPLHIGLLVMGAALAGGIAVKMTQQEPLSSTASARASQPNPVAKPVVARETPVAETKPTPMPQADASAPPAVYTEPRPEKRVRINEPKRVPTVVAQPIPSPEPALPAPVPYEAPPSPAQPTQPEIAAAQPPIESAPAPEPEPTPAPAPSPRRVVLRAGMPIAVRMDESLSSDGIKAGDTFSASLAEPLIVDGLVIAERGARVKGRVVNAQAAGRVNGTSLIELGLSSVTTSDGQRVTVLTEPWAKRGDTSTREDAAKIGTGAALGAIIGALAGGGKGAAIGAGVGGGAGAGTVIATRGKPVSVPAETVIRFRLASTVAVTERQEIGQR